MQKPSQSPYFLRIAVPSPLRRLFDYLPLPGQPLPEPGVRVKVSFGRQTLIGIVVKLESDTNVERSKLKTVLEVLDNSPLLDKQLLKLYRWASDYYMFPIGLALQASLPVAIREGRSLKQTSPLLWQLSELGNNFDTQSLSRAPLQKQVLDLLRSYQQMSIEELSAAIGKSARPILKALEEKALTETIEVKTEDKQPGLKEAPLKMNTEQAKALESLSEGLGRFQGYLLEGITGSGKTEVYLQLIEQVLKAGKQVLVLVPEISLTPQTIERFTQRFDCNLVCFHSGLSNKQRNDGWLVAHSGKADIIIGTRSAVFTPLSRPGLIIIDEEHDDSYKQQEGFRYSARDLAVVRASHLKIPILLGSATPSLESLQNALSGRYKLLHLGERAGAAKPPHIQLVDMKIQQANEGFSLTLQQQIAKHLAANQQVLVFLNRRGFAPVLQCLSCGWIAECQRCERSFTLHQQPAALRCHHCDSSKSLPSACPSCHNTQLGGIGFGTERSEAFLTKAFPDYPVIRIDRDTTRAVGSLQEKMDNIHSGLPCILVGTQMLAKGHHFPRVTLVAVLDADSGLFSADFRGQENLGQLLTQVSGRAGRGDANGSVLIQSYHINHPGLMQLINDGYGRFARSLLEQRKLGELPPFASFILLRAEASTRELPLKFLQNAKAICVNLQQGHLQIFGPLPSPIGKKAGLFRAQLIIQSNKRPQLQRLGHALIAALEQDLLARKVRWQIDVDPIDFS